MTTDPVDQLGIALDATGQVIAAVRPEQWGHPTPCHEWNVAALVKHVVAGNRLFARALAEPLAPTQDTPPTDQDLPCSYRDSAGALLEAFRRPDALNKIIAVPFGSVPGTVALHLRITELLVHGWDLARAIEHPANFPTDLVEQELAFSRAKLDQIPPGRTPFAPPQPVADDAPAIDRLAACLGRSVTTTPSTA